MRKLLITAAAAAALLQLAAQTVVVSDGRATSEAFYESGGWTVTAEGLTGTGSGNPLWSRRIFYPEEFTVTAELSIAEWCSGAPRVTIGPVNCGFDGGITNEFFLETDLASAVTLSSGKDHVTPGKPFTLTFHGKDGRANFKSFSYNITKELQDGEDFKKLCQDPDRPALVTAKAEDIRKWCSRHAEEMDFLFTLKRVRFKTDLDRLRFLHVSTFLPAHLARMMTILESGEDPEKNVTEAQQEEIRKEFDNVRKWLSGSGELISPELASIFDRYLSTQFSGRQIREVSAGFPKFVDSIGRSVCRQAVRRQD